MTRRKYWYQVQMQISESPEVWHVLIDDDRRFCRGFVECASQLLSGQFQLRIIRSDGKQEMWMGGQGPGKFTAPASHIVPTETHD